jgi:hypothetical protein
VSAAAAISTSSTAITSHRLRDGAAALTCDWRGVFGERRDVDAPAAPAAPGAPSKVAPIRSDREPVLGGLTPPVDDGLAEGIALGNGADCNPGEDVGR